MSSGTYSPPGSGAAGHGESRNTPTVHRCSPIAERGKEPEPLSRKGLLTVYGVDLLSAGLPETVARRKVLCPSSNAAPPNRSAQNGRRPKHRWGSPTGSVSGTEAPISGDLPDAASGVEGVRLVNDVEVALLGADLEGGPPDDVSALHQLACRHLATVERRVEDLPAWRRHDQQTTWCRPPWCPGFLNRAPQVPILPGAPCGPLPTGMRPP